MKATISKNYKFIQLSEKPNRAETLGFKLYHQYETETEMPISITNLIASKTRYYLNRLPEKARKTILKLEIKIEDEWFNVPLKFPNNNGSESLIKKKI